MHKAYASLACLALAVGVLAVSAPSEATSRADRPSQVRSTAESPIEHVVIIYQENHTFDDVLGGVCQTRGTPCDGYTGPVTFADGNTADNVVMPDLVPEILHDPDSQNLGMANEWDLIKGCTNPPYACVSHVDVANIPNLAALADTFAVSDATFAAGNSASFGAHVTLAAGTIDGFDGYVPVKSRKGVKRGPGWGCPSNLDARWGPKGRFEPSCIPDQTGAGPYRKSKVPYVPTIMERLEQAGLTWHIYQGDSETQPDDSAFSVCTYFWWCYANRFDISYDSSTADFVSDATNGALPTLSLVLPDSSNSQHSHTSMSVGDNYIGEVVSAVENSPEWDSTAVFITYDDCGCFYDHVTPPAGLGLRNPMVIVSPWVKPQSTDSTTAVQPYSMLAFIQHNFDLASLTQNVDDAYDYSNSFDFSQHPLRGVPMTTQSIPPSEQRRIVRLAPLVDDDPT